MDPKMGPKIPQKSTLGRPGPPGDANGRPEGSMEQFWSLWGLIFNPFGCNFGSIWRSFLRRTMFEPPELVCTPGTFVSGCPSHWSAFCRFALWTSGAFFLGDLNHHTSKPQRLQERGPAACGRSPQDNILILQHVVYIISNIHGILNITGYM